MSINKDALFPVSKIGTQLQNAQIASKIGITAPVFLSAVLEYMAAEVLSIAGKLVVSEPNSNTRVRMIQPVHIQRAIRNDTELNKLIDFVAVNTSMYEDT